MLVGPVRFVAIRVKLRTVSIMELHVVPATDGGVFRLLDELGERRLDVLTQRSLCEVDQDEPLSIDDEHVVVHAVSINRFGCWWYEEPDCNLRVDCNCTMVTLLEVLMGIAASNHQAALASHMQRSAELWDHFWSGEALLTNTSPSMRSACPSCLIEGISHVADLLSEARDLAAELGEALAAHHANVDLGLPRWPQVK